MFSFNRISPASGLQKRRFEIALVNAAKAVDLSVAHTQFVLDTRCRVCRDNAVSGETKFFSQVRNHRFGVVGDAAALAKIGGGDVFLVHTIRDSGSGFGHAGFECGMHEISCRQAGMRRHCRADGSGPAGAHRLLKGASPDE
jgi:hypothetical protein